MSFSAPFGHRCPHCLQPGLPSRLPSGQQGEGIRQEQEQRRGQELLEWTVWATGRPRHMKSKGLGVPGSLLEKCGHPGAGAAWGGRAGPSAGQQPLLQEVGEGVPVLPEEEEHEDQEGGAGDA